MRRNFVIALSFVSCAAIAMAAMLPVKITLMVICGSTVASAFFGLLYVACKNWARLEEKDPAAAKRLFEQRFEEWNWNNYIG